MLYFLSNFILNVLCIDWLLAFSNNLLMIKIIFSTYNWNNIFKLTVGEDRTRHQKIKSSLLSLTEISQQLVTFLLSLYLLVIFVFIVFTSLVIFIIFFYIDSQSFTCQLGFISQLSCISKLNYVSKLNCLSRNLSELLLSK